jgi:Rrf2 family protein
MNLSTKGRYGLKVLVDLAEMHGKCQCSIALKDIAARQDISLKYVELLFFILKNAGFVRSQRGMGGGYALNRPPSDITVMEVIMAFESPDTLSEQPAQHNCDCMANQKLGRFWQKVNTQMVEKFCNTTIQDLL